MEIIDLISRVIHIISIIVIVWGVIVAFLTLLNLEYIKLKGTNICKQRGLLRHQLGSYLLRGLEFMIAADIIHTIVRPDKNGLILLGSIVAIRTVISFFLNKEIETRHNCE